MYLLVLLFILAKPQITFSQALSIGQITLGSDPHYFQLNEFQIISMNPSIQTQWLNESLQWIRNDKNQLLPQVILKIDIIGDHYPLFIYTNNTLFIPTYHNDNSKIYSSLQIPINLFNPPNIQIYEGSKKIDTLKIIAKTNNQLQNSNSQNDSKLSKHWIDHTCLGYNVRIENLDNQYLSIGCQMQRTGAFGSEKPRLEIFFNSPNLKPLSVQNTYQINILNNPVEFIFTESGSIKTEWIDVSNQEKVNFKLNASVPEKIPRVKLAIGFGPYSFSNKYLEHAKGPETTFSYMLYGKLSLTDSTSIKMFDALIYKDTFFNNSGAYYSFDVGRLLDGRIILGTLLGFQGIHYKYSENQPTEFEITYPQGFELTYLHPFGINQSYLNYGMFLSTTQEIYKNIWLRFGQKIFYELNYFNWEKDKSKIEMWGISVGIPIGQFL